MMNAFRILPLRHASCDENTRQFGHAVLGLGMKAWRAICEPLKSDTL